MWVDLVEGNECPCGKRFAIGGGIKHVHLEIWVLNCESDMPKSFESWYILTLSTDLSGKTMKRRLQLGSRASRMPRADSFDGKYTCKFPR